MIERIRKSLAMIAAIGAVRRRGIGALEAYGGKVEGQGYVRHKSGPKKGQTTEFEMKGRPVGQTK